MDACHGCTFMTLMQSQPFVAPNYPALASARVRQHMVAHLRQSGIGDKRVLDAMEAVPRHLFIDPAFAAQAYQDIALPIGQGQTISKPSVVARMVTLACAARSLNKVLEIGTGCGYQTALLSQFAGEVYSVERIRLLNERAKKNLRPLRAPNIRLHYGDGCRGLIAAAPFDVILVSAAAKAVPAALPDQLEIGGRLLVPIGRDGHNEQVLVLVERLTATQWRESQFDPVFFVPLQSGVM
jgi:protein-L-isoaspartate(D-aspartate) O-methyltransferase